MKNTYRIIPIYTGDVSGTCSALYELGGMTVIHDPSGCNSTYNTHDETRWYDRESLIYISGLNEIDAITGNDDKFIKDILYAAEEMKPKFVAMTNSPLPYLNGTDFKGIARLLESKLDIPVFYVKSNGSHDYSMGAGDAFLELAKKLFLGRERERNNLGKNTKKQFDLKISGKNLPNEKTKINILGVTPLDFDGIGVVDSLIKKFENFEIVSVWAMGNTLTDIGNALSAEVNVVVSVTGLKLAEWMRDEFGVPFVCGSPIGDFSEDLFAMIEKAGTGSEYMDSKSLDFKTEGKKSTGTENSCEKDIVFIGEPITMWSLKEHVKKRYGRVATVVNPLEKSFYGADFQTIGEEDVEEILASAKIVVGDPFYKYIAPEGAKFYEISHEAFSGRCFIGERKNLFGGDVYVDE
ncbi:MAG: nitrogenase component 1 [Lachnospiraceae bacterium]|nr:nitrogenase component 1 [Lachnospiraceae bacterium]